MLKALELIGFKSFADKTRFEFPEGITVIVGPNGSGKSNIVDAIKWVLGEQSAKSLRGKDMADVIFKGSGGSTGRKPLNTAEATIIIDNSDSRLSVDAPEVHITRRVYRSGEGEYLINRQPCRLRDIRDLFRGTGVGTDAYSLIEQGKVDQLLQATPKDRRAIFEEAAGISRFKAKKIEAQRRLDRVEQNLLRLSDIVDEVESRLKSVRAQATKARRYKEYSDRLQQLRTHVGLTDWHQLTARLTRIESELSELREEIASLVARAESFEAQSLEMEVEITQTDEAIRAYESRAAGNRERIAGLESSMEHERSRYGELEVEEASHRQQLAAMSGRANDLHVRLRETQSLLDQAKSEHRRVAEDLSEHDRAAKNVAHQLERLRSDNEARRNDHVEQLRVATTLGNQIAVLESELSGTESTAQRCRKQAETLQIQCQELSDGLAKLVEDRSRLVEQTDRKASELETVQRWLDQGRQVLAARKDELSHLRLRHSAATERMSVLQELERKFEGIGKGVQTVLAAAKNDANGPFRDVQGLVADLVKADVNVAPLIDVALGQRSQCVVVSGTGWLDHLRRDCPPLGGPVGFVRRDDVATKPIRPSTDLTGQPGVIGRADRMVQTAPENQNLIELCLGGTWLVDDLPAALDLWQKTTRAVRLVTREGHLLDSDGTMVIGASQPSTGLVSRRSQLRALELQISDLEQQIELIHQEIDRHQAEVYQQQQAQQRLASEHQAAYTSLSECQIQNRAVEQQLEQTNKQRLTVEAEMRTAQKRGEITTRQLAEMQQQLTDVNDSITALESSLHDDDQAIQQLQSQRQTWDDRLTATKVEMAKKEQHVRGLCTQLSQLEEDQRERGRAIEETRRQLQQCLNRKQQTERTILQATSEVASLYLLKQSVAQETLESLQQRQSLADQRTALSRQLQQQRKVQRELEQKQHQTELSAGELQHERTTLADRLLEDYDIDITQLALQEDTEEQRKRTEIEEEIAELRRKVNNIGGVNLDALEELEGLEARYETLSNQYQDLHQAKESLERIISRINADSRRLFTETLEAIRTNFQTLYRKSFGGGRADIVLEDAEDVLESGVEIIATPPGKPEFNNSLLSGGEKALTAVSLLLAIFQYRPSPFCVLDEVDAPFDEANIGRFIDVLKGFLGWTKFVIVTHSKKTMTAATTLYGVTMQESGVSKQVSVRFEDVSEDGHISAEALEREAADDAAA